MPTNKGDEAMNVLDRRRNTKMHFMQNKFNLLIEESEGYSKLITEIAEHLQQESSKEILQRRIFELIGQFKLDPNRYAIV